MDEISFNLNISADDLLRYYSGAAQVVVVRAYDGRRVQFPAASLRGFVTPEGVQGVFRLRFDGNRKLVGLQRIAR